MQALDLFLAGDDVAVKKPDPSIYLLAAKRLGLEPTECVVIEDSAIGCKVRRMRMKGGPLNPIPYTAMRS